MGEKKNIGAHWALSSMKTWCLHPACRAEHWFGSTGNNFPGGSKGPHHAQPCAPLWGRRKAEVGITLPPTPGRTVASAWSLLNIRDTQPVLPLRLPTVTLEHPCPKGSTVWHEALGLLFPSSKPGNRPRDLASLSFPSPVQKSFFAIFVHKASLRELRDHKQFVSSALKTFPNTLAFQPLQWRTSQPPSPIYRHNSKILAPLPTSSSLKLSESKDHLGEPAASAALPAPVGVRCGKQQLLHTPSHAQTLFKEKYQNFQDYPTCYRESCWDTSPKVQALCHLLHLGSTTHAVVMTQKSEHSS